MNDLKRYDEALSQQLQHLPMPGEDFAWDTMSKMLDKDDDDPVFIPFYKRWGCLLLALLAVVIIAGGGWLYMTNNKNIKGQVEPSTGKTGTVNNTRFNEADSSRINNDSLAFTKRSPSQSGKDTTEGEKNSIKKEVNSTSEPETLTGKSSTENRNGTKNLKSNNALPAGRTSKGYRKNNNISGNKKSKSGNYNSERTVKAVAAIIVKDPGNFEDSLRISINNSRDSALVEKDSLPKEKPKLAAKALENELEEADEEKVDDKIKLNFAAGLSIYQPLNLSGVSSVPYNFYGRKGSLADYLPAPYLRAYSKKWSLHTEFRYGAPQYVKPFIYKEIILDSSVTNYRTANFQLRKTYYQQVPLTVHYNVLPNLSVGAGMIFNRFQAALVDRNTYKRMGGQTDSLESSVLQKIKKESSFSTNHFQWTAEINYNWKRLFVGARFSRDIDAFIKYKDINTGQQTEKKLKALNLFVRYDLWRSKQKL